MGDEQRPRTDGNGEYFGKMLRMLGLRDVSNKQELTRTRVAMSWIERAILTSGFIATDVASISAGTFQEVLQVYDQIAEQFFAQICPTSVLGKRRGFTTHENRNLA